MSKWALVSVALVAAALAGCSTGSSAVARADDDLDAALQELVAAPSGPPGVVVVVQRESEPKVHAFGVADVKTGARPTGDDFMRIASVAKAFSGAVALSLVDDGKMSLDDTVGSRLPDAPEAIKPVTLRQLLNHTSGVPDFTGAAAFRDALPKSLEKAPPPRELIDYIKDEPLAFPPGSRHAYSNSDNILVALMAQAATGMSYEDALAAQVLRPLGLDKTRLPSGTELPEPALHGYEIAPPDPPEDVTSVVAAGWAWASGGIVSTPKDLNDFIRGYVGKKLFGDKVADEQRQFIVGAGSEPTGPGDNSAGLGLFRYDTSCGIVYGHTGNTAGYTQFAAASPDGRRSVTVSMSLQHTQNFKDAGANVFTALRRAEEKAVCAALATG